MSHYKNLLDPSRYLGSQDFTPEGREVTISRAVREKMAARPGEPEQSAPMLYILQKDGVEYPRPYKVPKTVMFGLSLLLGTETDNWKGQKITLYSAYCMSFGEKEPCIRLRFPDAVEEAIRKWLKKRKVNPSAYLCRE
jgi:hypothetical protein